MSDVCCALFFGTRGTKVEPTCKNQTRDASSRRGREREAHASSAGTRPKGNGDYVFRSPLRSHRGISHGVGSSSLEERRLLIVTTGVPPRPTSYSQPQRWAGERREVGFFWGRAIQERQPTLCGGGVTRTRSTRSLTERRPHGRPKRNVSTPLARLRSPPPPERASELRHAKN